jgi:hypothetical protein
MQLMECIFPACLQSKEMQYFHWVYFAVNKEHIDVSITQKLKKKCAWQNKEQKAYS